MLTEVQSYLEQARQLHAQGEERAAHAALAEAFALAVPAGDAATLGHLWRLAGDFAHAEGGTEAAQDAYAYAAAQFAEAGDTVAVREVEECRRQLEPVSGRTEESSTESTKV